MNEYIIVFNSDRPYFTTDSIHEVVTSLPLSDWWHHIPNTYIVRSVHTEKTLADGIIVRLPNILFLITKVDLGNANGVLNKNAWEWMTKKTKAVFKIKPIPKIKAKSVPPLKFKATSSLEEILTPFAPQSPKRNSTLDNIFGTNRDKK